MAAVWYRFRVELRTRWRSVLALALLAGVAGGVVLTAIAGARRTDSAYTRLRTATADADVLVNPDAGTSSKLPVPRVEHLAGVVQAGRVDGINLFPADVRNDDDFGRFGVVVASRGAFGFRFGRPKILDGRMSDRAKADEIVVNAVLAEQSHLHVGSVVRAGYLTSAEVERVESGQLSPEAALDQFRRGTFGTKVALRVTGIEVNTRDLVVDEGFAEPEMLLTPAFLRRHPDVSSGYYGIGVRLRGGATAVPAFRARVHALAPDEAIAFQTAAASSTKVDRAVQPSVLALTVFAIVVGLTALLLVGQALARQSFLDSSDYPTLRALGLTRTQLFAAAMLRATVVGMASAVLAVVLAVAASTVTPIGVARTAEPDPGIRVDGLVLGLGSLAVMLALLALAAGPAWHHARRRSEGAERALRTSIALTNVGARPAMAEGVRMALEPGRGRTAVPARTTIVSAFLTIATVTGAIVFAASLDRLVSTPRLYGWNWDLRIGLESESSSYASDQKQIEHLLDSSRLVKNWSRVSLGDVTVDGSSMPAVGIHAGGGPVYPSIASGHVPRHDDEIALGARTMRALGVGIGDTVTARLHRAGTTKLRVVGRVVLPGFGTYPGSDKTALGEGAAVTATELNRLGPSFHKEPYLVDLRPGADRSTLIARVRKILGTSANDPTGFEVVGAQRPSDIIAYERVRNTPIVLAGVLALLAAATIAHALVTSVRRRRRDLALLKTLGFTRGQVSSTVAWQASTVAAIALLAGLPLGIILGRWGWRALADNLGTVAEPVVPALAMVVTVPVVVVLANLVAFVPGRIAARLRPAAVLRSE